MVDLSLPNQAKRKVSLELSMVLQLVTGTVVHKVAI